MKSLLVLFVAALLLPSAVFPQPDLSNWAVSAECKGVKTTRRAVYRIVVKLRRSEIFANSYEFRGGLTKRSTSERLMVKYDLRGAWTPPENLEGIGLAAVVRDKHSYHGPLAAAAFFDSAQDDSPARGDKFSFKFFRADSNRAALSIICTVFKVKWPVPVATPTVTVDTELTTNNWAGAWYCPHPQADGYMTISGQGMGSTVTIDFPSAAYGPGRDEFTFESVVTYGAAGTYLYHNNFGQRVWPGHFTIDLVNNSIELERDDDSSAWHGSYVCVRDND